MNQEEQKEKILNGEIAIFKVVDMQGHYLRNETMTDVEIRDFLTESNFERMCDLMYLYDGQEIVCDGERYKVICGQLLIAKLIKETAEFMQETVEDSLYTDEEAFDEYYKSNAS